MADGTLSEDILNQAIYLEIHTRDFYREIAAKIENKKGNSQMLKLANQEDFHRDILEARFKKLFEREFVQDPEYPKDPKIASVKSAVFDQSSAKEVISIGITGENNAIQLYRKQIDTVTDAEDISLLKKLVKFEEQHKKTLQKIYARLEKKFSWI